MLTRLFKPLSAAVLCLAMIAVLSSCASKGPWRPKNDKDAHPIEQASVHLLGKKLKGDFETTNALLHRTDNGRMKVSVSLMNRGSKPRHVQTRVVFMEDTGVSTGDETDWEELYFEPRQTKTIRAESLVTYADYYQVQIRPYPGK